MSDRRRLVSYAQTNLGESKPRGYLEIYEEYFAPLARREIRLLELGVKNGVSLLMWRDYFPNGIIAGVDLKAIELGDPRIRTYQGHQEDTALLTRIAREIAPDGFDIIIDDCAHVGELARTSFWHLFMHALKPAGIYAIEDWGTGYWGGHREFPDGHLYQPRERETMLHRIARGVLRNLGAESKPRGPVQRRVGRLAQHALGRYQYRRRFAGHDYGMVGFVKQLVDECGMRDITSPDFGIGQRPSTPPTSSRIARMLVSPGLVIVTKVPIGM